MMTGIRVREQPAAAVDFVQDVAAVCRPACGQEVSSRISAAPQQAGMTSMPPVVGQHVAGHARPSALAVVRLAHFPDDSATPSRKAPLPQAGSTTRSGAVLAGQALGDVQSLRRVRRRCGR